MQQSVPLVTFVADDGEVWSLPLPAQRRLLVYFGVATIEVLGPKAKAFLDEFSNHRATLLKADGKDILSVKVILNGAEKD